MVKRKKKRKIPKSFIRIDPKPHTTFLQDKETGRMLGRKYIKNSGKTDKTRVRRAFKGSSKGRLFGRTKAFPVRASSKKRGTTKTIRRRL